MGREPAGKGQRLLLHLAVGLMGVFLIGGCRHFEAQTTPIERLLHRAEACRRQQNFVCAEELLAPARDRETAPTDPRVIYLAGKVAADVRNPARNLPAARNCFQRVVRDYPASPLAFDAAVWVGLLDELNTHAEAVGRLQNANDRLQQEIGDHKAHLRRMEKRLESLKAVDLSLE